MNAGTLAATGALIRDQDGVVVVVDAQPVERRADGRQVTGLHRQAAKALGELQHVRGVASLEQRLQPDPVAIPVGEPDGLRE